MKFKHIQFSQLKIDKPRQCAEQKRKTATQDFSINLHLVHKKYKQTEMATLAVNLR